MAIPETCVEVVRPSDGEVLGWAIPERDRWAVIDRLGVNLGEAENLESAEAVLTEGGLAYLAEPYELLVEGQWVRVRIVEVSNDEIRVKQEDWGAIDGPSEAWTLPFPMPDSLRPA